MQQTGFSGFVIVSYKHKIYLYFDFQCKKYNPLVESDYETQTLHVMPWNQREVDSMPNFAAPCKQYELCQLTQPWSQVSPGRRENDNAHVFRFQWALNAKNVSGLPIRYLG